MSKDIDWSNELIKCEVSPYYFYTNYCTINGKIATTALSEDEFNNFVNPT